MISNVKIKSLFREYQPKIANEPLLKHAEVAFILCGKKNLENMKVVFIQRSISENDPWSGQMAFPGGRREDIDTIAGDAACRESFEEIGVRLKKSNQIGRLDDLFGRTVSKNKDLVVSCFVYSVECIPSFAINNEVLEVVMIPVYSLLDPQLFTRIQRQSLYQSSYPGIRIRENDERVIWGLTYRFIRNFFGIFDYKLPEF